jgi:hypothetical protein
MKKKNAWIAGVSLSLATLGPVSMSWAQGQAGAAPNVVAIGDIHGDLEALLTILRQRKLIDVDGNWTGGKTNLVMLGDLNDRGPDTRVIMDLLMNLEKQAPGSGGKVVSVLGNHELMVLQGDLRYTSPNEIRQFKDVKSGVARGEPSKNWAMMTDVAKKTAGVELKTFKNIDPAYFGSDQPLNADDIKTFVKVFHGDNVYSRWLGQRPAIVKVGDTLYLHGGLGTWALLENQETVNKNVAAWVSYFQGKGPQPPEDTEWVLSDVGPLWSRDLANGKYPESWVDAILKAYGAKRIVVGHTPKDKITSEYHGKVICADSGITTAYGGKLSSVQISADGKTDPKYVDRPKEHSELYRKLSERFLGVKMKQLPVYEQTHHDEDEHGSGAAG